MVKQQKDNRKLIMGIAIGFILGIGVFLFMSYFSGSNGNFVTNIVSQNNVWGLRNPSFELTTDWVFSTGSTVSTPIIQYTNEWSIDRYRSIKIYSKDFGSWRAFAAESIYIPREAVKVKADFYVKDTRGSQVIPYIGICTDSLVSNCAYPSETGRSSYTENPTTSSGILTLSANVPPYQGEVASFVVVGSDVMTGQVVYIDNVRFEDSKGNTITPHSPTL